MSPDNPLFEPPTQPGALPKPHRQLPQRHVDRLLAVLADGRPRRTYRIEDELQTGEHWRVFDTCCALADEGLLVRSQDSSGVDVFALAHDNLCSEGVQAGDQTMPCDCAGPSTTEPAPSVLPASYAPPDEPPEATGGTIPNALAGARFIRLVSFGHIPQAPPVLPASGPHWMATDDLEVVDRWLAGGGNLGLLLRDLVVLDVDPKHALPAMAETSRDANISIADGIAEQLRGRGLPRTLTQRTRSGGLHFLYRARPKVVYDELPWPELRGDGGPLVECRSGAHRWIILTPSKFRPPLADVRWLYRGHLAEAPDWLPHRPWQPPARPLVPTARDRARDHAREQLDAAVDFHAQLQADGWTFLRHQAGYWLLVRPGKQPSDGASATLDKVAPGVLHVFSTAAPLPVGNYDGFGYLTVVHFDGNVMAALAAFERPR